MNWMVKAGVTRGDQVQAMDFPVHRLYNLGSATRDPSRAEAHQTEMAEAGVAIALEVPPPRVYPMAPAILTTTSEVYVQGHHTSGEAEIVVVSHEGELYVGVGSDHTDRDLETTSILWSKQVCPNVLAPELWLWADVAKHWDRCELELDVDGEPYQRLPVSMFLTPPQLMSTVRDRAKVPVSGVWVFGGTGASISRKLAFGHHWEFRLVDPALNRRLEHYYDVTILLDEVQPKYRVPLVR